MAVAIRPAVWPQDEPVAIPLLQNYAAFLSADPNGAASICLTNYNKELASLALVYAPPAGVLLLAFVDSVAAGCVAVKTHAQQPGACELKRLWVEPRAQGLGVGRQLTRAAIHWAEEQGATALLLDTVPAAMPQAAALYRSLGFLPTERYNQNDVPGLEFLRLELR